MKLKNILGVVFLSGASFVAGHDFGLVYPTVQINETFIKEEYERLAKEEKIIIEYKTLYDAISIDPDIRERQIENMNLINKTWVYRFMKY